MDRKKDTIKNNLSEFLNKHCLEDCISSVDDIVLDYMLSVLEDLGDEGNTEQDIDVDQFVEVMAAYLPGFDKIKSAEVVDWMFWLTSRLLEEKQKVGKETSKTEADLHQFIAVPSTTKDISTSPRKGRRNQRGRRKISGSDGESRESRNEDDAVFEEQVKAMLEMFPGSCTMEVSHCLMLTNGDVDSAVHLILHRQESGDCISSASSFLQGKQQKGSIVEDKRLKEQMLEKYGFVDMDDDKKTHKPALFKQDEKKLVRYRDNCVVSTRGERFSEVKKNENDEMKKTYVSLKPARKYRFH